MSFTVRQVRSEKKPSRLRALLSVGLPLVLSALQMEKHLKEAKKSDNEQKRREKSLKRTVTVLLSCLFVLLLLIGTLKAVVRLKAMAFGMVSLVGAEVAADKDGYTNLLLLGAGDKDHDGIDLTDTIMVTSLDPAKTKSVVMLSIPRDTYILKTEKMGKNRINSLYRDYKAELAREGMSKEEASAEALKQLGAEIGTLLGLEIHGVVKVNFSGFVEGVDLLGGVDIEVPSDIVDTEYPGPNYTYETFSIGAGKQHFDGETALKYARSRHSTSDFSRSARQQQIIAAVAAKAQEQGLVKNLGKISEMLSIVAKNMESTFSARELLGLAAMGKAIDSSRIVSVQLNDQNGLYGSSVGQGGFLYAPPREEFDGAAVLLPVSIPEFPVTWKQIDAYVNLLVRNRALFIREIPIVVLNAGAKEGLARKMGGELYRYDLDVEATRNLGGGITTETSSIAVNPALETGGDATRAKLMRAQQAAKFLSEVLKIQQKESVSPEAFSKEGADVAIILGKDYSYTPLQDLLK